jgi:hypothetical protein
MWSFYVIGAMAEERFLGDHARSVGGRDLRKGA